jgi:hypothetical protein
MALPQQTAPSCAYTDHGYPAGFGAKGEGDSRPVTPRILQYATAHA